MTAVAPASADGSLKTFALAYDDEITLPGFVLWMNMLAGMRGAGLLRVKGIVNVEGRPYAVQAVQTVLSEPVALDELLRQVADDAALEAHGRGCEVRLTGTSTAASVEGDPALLHSALDNVLRNAVRHTSTGSEVEVSWRSDAAGHLITIADRGPGVPEAMLPRIFEPFVRVGEARDRASGGYGLGLAIAQRAVHAHGGEIRARNRSGGGLAVEIRLPAGAALSRSDRTREE